MRHSWWYDFQGHPRSASRSGDDLSLLSGLFFDVCKQWQPILYRVCVCVSMCRFSLRRRVTIGTTHISVSKTRLWMSRHCTLGHVWTSVKPSSTTTEPWTTWPSLVCRRTRLYLYRSECSPSTTLDLPATPSESPHPKEACCNDSLLLVFLFESQLAWKHV